MPKPPKIKCCESTPRCKRCPIRMLKDGTLPPGYTVKKRRLCEIDADGRAVPVKKDKKKSKKSKKAKAAKKQRKTAEKAARLAA